MAPSNSNTIAHKDDAGNQRWHPIYAQTQLHTEFRYCLSGTKTSLTFSSKGRLSEWKIGETTKKTFQNPLTSKAFERVPSTTVQIEN